MDAKQTLLALQTAQREAARRQQEEAEQLARQQAALIERIKAGETTGDPILDFVTVCWSGDERIYDHLKTLQDSLVGMAGQYILTIETEKEWVTTGPPGGFGPSGFEELKQCDVSLGQLEDERLVVNFNNGSFGFKTGRHAKRVSRHLPFMAESDILFDNLKMVRFPAIQKLLQDPWGYSECRNCTTISVMAGNENIFKWLDDLCGMSINITNDELLEMAIILFCATRGPVEPEPTMPSKVISWWSAKKTAIDAEIAELNRKIDAELDEWSGVQKRVTSERHAQLSREIRENKLILEAKQELAAKLQLDRCPATIADPVPAGFSQSAGCG